MSDDWHTCHFCGTYVKDGIEYEGARHWLSDCRPDLVEHEIGPTCTWLRDVVAVAAGTKAGVGGYRPQDCYAYQDPHTHEWTDKHVYFYKDGPT